MSATLAPEAATAAEPMQYLTFHLAGEQYALGILQVREILRYETVTAVPTAPAAVRGVLNLRGSVVPVVDLAVRFGMPPTEAGSRTCIVIVEVHSDGERTVMGILADSVSQVLELPAAEIEPPPAFGAGVRVEYLRGMARMGSKFALVLDLDRVLSLAELRVGATAAESASPDDFDPAASHDEEAEAEAVAAAEAVPA